MSSAGISILISGSGGSVFDRDFLNFGVRVGIRF